MLSDLRDLRSHHQLVFTLIIAFGLVGIWRGLWRLLDLTVFPGSPTLSAAATFGLGVGVIALTHDEIDGSPPTKILLFPGVLNFRSFFVGLFPQKTQKISKGLIY